MNQPGEKTSLKPVPHDGAAGLLNERVCQLLFDRDVGVLGWRVVLGCSRGSRGEEDQGSDGSESLHTRVIARTRSDLSRAAKKPRAWRQIRAPASDYRVDQ